MKIGHLYVIAVVVIFGALTTAVDERATQHGEAADLELVVG